VESVGTEAISDNARFAQRAAELIAHAEADMPHARARFFTVICDGCGRTVQVDYRKPALPKGWTAQKTGDFCAQCSAGAN
jgi:hypothetical protein